MKHIFIDNNKLGNSSVLQRKKCVFANAVLLMTAAKKKQNVKNIMKGLPN